MCEYISIMEHYHATFNEVKVVQAPNTSYIGMYATKKKLLIEEKNAFFFELLFWLDEPFAAESKGNIKCWSLINCENVFKKSWR